jgi:ABC-type dipeptide/oligopeptide/nickel transport system permease subunit
LTTMKEFADFMRANPQVLILLLICLVLGLGTFIIVLLGVASSGSTKTTGYPSDAIFVVRTLL